MGPLILAAFIVGALVIILSYVEVLPDHGSGWYLAGGIVAMVDGPRPGDAVPLTSDSSIGDRPASLSRASR